MLRYINPIALKQAAGFLCVMLVALVLPMFLFVPWSMSILIGGPADSPWLAQGFHAKEVSGAGLYRWTNGDATLRLPNTGNAYLVTVNASTGPLTQQEVSVLQHGRTVTTFTVDQEFRDNSFYWRPGDLRLWFLAPTSSDLTLHTEAQSVEGDNRRLGIVLKEFKASTVGGPSVVPFAWVALTVGALWLLIRPDNRRRWAFFASSSMGMAVLYLVVAWRPPITGTPWLPVPGLPSVIALGLWGLVLTLWKPSSLKRLALASIGAIALVTALLVTVTLQWSVNGPDFEWHASHGSSLERVLRYHDFYPLGFPLTLWLGSKLMGDPLIAGRLAALIAVVVVVALTLLMSWRITGKRGVIVTSLLLVASPVLLAYGIFASSDIVQLVPLVGVFVLLTWKRDLTRSLVWWSGVLLGVAYLFRFQAAIFVAALSLWLVAQPSMLPERWSKRGGLRRWGFLYGAFIFVSGFVVGSMPQWLLDIRDTGRPYYSRQQENIWQAAYQDPNLDVLTYGRDGGNAAQPDLGLLDIIAFDPFALARHWSANLHQFLNSAIHELYIWPVGLLMLAALALTLIHRTDPRLKLILVAILTYIPVIALTWNKDRFYLPIIPLFAVLGAWVISEKLSDSTVFIWRWRVSLGVIVQTLLLLWIMQQLGAMENILPTYGQLR